MTTRRRGMVFAISGIAITLFYLFVYLAIGPHLEMRHQVEESRRRLLADLGIDYCDPQASNRLAEEMVRDVKVYNRVTDAAEHQAAKLKAVENELNGPGSIPGALRNVGLCLGTFRAPGHVTGVSDFWPGMIQVIVLLGLGVYWGRSK